MKSGIKNFFAKTKQKLVLHKHEILRIVTVVLGLVFGSFLISRLVFGQSFNQYRFFFVLAIISLVLFFWFFRKKIGDKPEIGFLAIALICGTLLAFSEPKYYVSWDEQIHFKHAEKITSGVFKGMYSRPNKSPFSYSIAEQKQNDALMESQYKKPKTKSSNGKKIYTQIAYIPSMIAMALGYGAHIPYNIVFVIGRWFNLLAYAMVVYFAIKRLKSGKMIMAVIALFPTSIFLASNYNHDSWVTAFMMLGLAYLFSELQEPNKKINLKDTIIMIGAFVVGLGPKTVYAPIMLLLFLLKPSKFHSFKRYRQYLIACMGAMLLVLSVILLPILFNGPGSGGDSRGGSAVDSSQQIKFILSDPIAYAKILLNFMVGYLGMESSKGFVTSFAYLRSMAGYFLVFLSLVAVVFLDKNEIDKKISTFAIRTSVVLLSLITISIICTGLYVGFTSVRSLSIAGVQPRYLIPLLFPMLYVIGSSRVKNPFNRNIFNFIILALMSGVFLNGVWTLIISKYY